MTINEAMQLKEFSRNLGLDVQDYWNNNWKGTIIRKAEHQYSVRIKETFSLIVDFTYQIPTKIKLINWIYQSDRKYEKIDRSVAYEGGISEISLEDCKKHINTCILEHKKFILDEKKARIERDFK